jgi:hypothetical protein
MVTILERERDDLPTLYLVTLPLPIFVGNYDVRRISAEDAARIIRNAYDSEDWQVLSAVHVGTTAALLTQISGRTVRRVDKARLPTPRDGDRFLFTRLATGVERESFHQPLTLLDVKFQLCEYTREEGLED